MMLCWIQRPMAILILSADHKVERCNPAAARMIGIEGKQAIGKPHGDIGALGHSTPGF